ncbi:divisome protein SepX/GlpR [Mycolicibacterium grossiae]|uniref:Transmembrane protein n=1 Tax=Mycolicibacterium grossiae TaxID=1552759 RepID=A0A1E8QCG6_9MYCO|nr:gephyrin-like molybdotransferase receptor GlpR [Mycolicibacterium grossiae]OFJ55724.1 hypothetical protein BEL07_00500 [Mycolicibacterium grossiae]QEM43439.1 hypothetical protein FZ046_00400 [Mycolicibacterium grossiae]
MPSIPQSLLWISLVVLWLFVLVPMLISKRDTVRRTSDVALATRVLNTGRSARLLRRRGPAAGHYSDPHWQPSDEAEDDFEGDDGVTAPRKTIVLAASSESEESEYLDVDVVEMDSGALPVGATQPRREDPQLPLDFDAPRTAPEPVVEAGPVTAAIRTPADADFSDADSDTAEETAGKTAAPVAEAPAAEPAAAVAGRTAQDGTDRDGTDHDYEYVDDSSGLETPDDGEDDARLGRPAAPRRDRFESKTAAAVRERKFAFRKRMLLAMGTLVLLSGVAAFFVSGALWYVCGAVGAVTVLYLAYLRRQTRIEEQLRRRRAQRLSRSRLGVENTDDPEFEVVPERLRRPGSVVLEIDDEDPVFEHLDYVPFSRTYDLPLAAGQ